MTGTFWTAVRAQLTELRTAKTADDVIRILGPDRNPYGTNWDGMDGAAEGFFAGSGGDDTVMGALLDGGWLQVWPEYPLAGHFWVMRAPNGDLITYCEGDIYRGDKAKEWGNR